jgi:hypothetical protein
MLSVPMIVLGLLLLYVAYSRHGHDTASGSVTSRG